MAFFLKLTRAEVQERPIYINADLIERITWSDAGERGYSTLKFGNEDSTNVRERPDQIIAMLDQSRRGGIA